MMNNGIGTEWRLELKLILKGYLTGKKEKKLALLKWRSEIFFVESVIGSK